MKRMILAGLMGALLMPLAASGAEAAAKKKKQSTPQVAGFLQTSATASTGLLKPYQRNAANSGVTGNSRVAQFFFYQQVEGR
jgi:hypothetical protein